MNNMPQVGQISSAKEIHKNYDIKLNFRQRSKYRFSACPICGATRWLRIKESFKNCRKCSDKKRRKWPQHLEIISYKDYRKLHPESKKRTAQVKYTCSICNTQKYVSLYSYHEGQVCNNCNPHFSRKFMRDKKGENSVCWKTQIRKANAQGYIIIRIPPSDPFFAMTSKDKRMQGMALEHRIIMARHLGRCLERYEIVHHKNGIKDDNRIENLELFSCQSYHVNSHVPVSVKAYIGRLEQRIKDLEREVG